GGFDLASILGCGDELTWGDDGRCATMRVAPWREIQIAHFPGDRLSKAATEEEPGHEVEPAGEDPADRPAHQPAERANPGLAVQRPGPRIADDQPNNQFGSAGGEAQADGAAPVLDHEHDVGEAQLADEALQQLALLAGQEAEAGCGA